MPGKKYKWPVAKEDILIQRFEDHPFMFDMGESDYHDNDKKAEFLKDVSKELGVPVSQVEKRWRSFRSNHGRLVKELKEGKSGSAGKTMSTRKKWLVKRLSFLNKHIKTRTTKSSLDYVQDEEKEEEDVATPGTSGMNDDQEVTEATPQTDDEGEEEEEEEEGEENSVVAADGDDEEQEEVQDQDCDNPDDEEEAEEEEGEDAEATSQVDEEHSKQKIIDLLHTPEQPDKDTEGQEVPGSAQPSQSDPESQDIQDEDELPTIDPVKKDGDIVPNPAGSHDSEDDDSDIQKNLPYKEDGTLEEEVIVEPAKDKVKESDSGQKRQLEVWEEDLLPPAKKIKVIKEEKTNTNLKKLKKTDATSTKADVKAGNSKEELTDEELRARPPTPPLPKEDEKKVPVVKKKKSHDDSGGEPKTKDKVHKPTPAKTKKALKTLKDFKALVAEDDDIEDEQPMKIVNPKPPKKILEDTSGAKKDKKGGKNKDPAKAIVQKKGEAPQRLTMTVKKDLAEVNKKNKEKDKDKNEARLDSLEEISDRRLNIVEKVVESWDDFGKRMSQGGGSDGKAQQPVILPMKAHNDFTDEENFWSGLMVTKLRRVRDSQIRDDVMLQCEQLVNDAIRDNRKKEAAVEMGATTTTNLPALQGSSSQSLTPISQVAHNSASKSIPNASSSRPGNAAASSSSSSSATAISTSQRGPQSFTAMLSTPPRAVDNQYAVMQNVQASNLHPSMQQAVSALPMQGYGQGMWPPGSPSIPQVYCNNYYGGYSTNVPGHDMQGQMGQK